MRWDALLLVQLNWHSLCFTHLQKVDKLVMADPQVFIDGIGPLGLLPRFAAELGVKLLQQYWLRESANVVGGAPCLGCARAPPSQAKQQAVAK